jgi:hypothetical protein
VIQNFVRAIEKQVPSITDIIFLRIGKLLEEASRIKMVEASRIGACKELGATVGCSGQFQLLRLR